MLKIGSRVAAAFILSVLSPFAVAGVHLSGFSVGGSGPPSGGASGLTIPTHVFDFIFEDGFNCTDSVPLGTELATFFSSLPAGNHTVCLKAGTYTVNIPISVPSNTNVRGAGQGPNRSATTLFLAPNVNNNTLYVQGKQNVSISHLKVDGNGANQPQNYPAGMFITGSGNVRLQDIEVANTASINVAATLNNYVYISSSYFHDMHKWTSTSGAIGAVYLSGPASGSPQQFAWVYDNYVVGNNNGPGGDGGIDCYGTDHVSVYNNTLVNTGESSIYTATPGCTNFAIFSNDIHNSSEFGIDITLGASNVTISNNLIDGTGVAAMVLWQDSNVSVTYNTMKNGHSYPPSTPCKSVVIDHSTNVTVDATNWVDSGPLSCIKP